MRRWSAEKVLAALFVLTFAGLCVFLFTDINQPPLTRAENALRRCELAVAINSLGPGEDYCRDALALTGEAGGKADLMARSHVQLAAIAAQRYRADLAVQHCRSAFSAWDGVHPKPGSALDRFKSDSVAVCRRIIDGLKRI